MSADLKILFPAKEITVKGEVLTVMPFYAGQYPKALELLQPIAGTLQDSGILQFDTSGGKINLSMAGDWVFYAPPAGFTNSDTFGFTATDKYGGSVPAISTVNIAVDNAPSQNVFVDDLGNGSFRLRFSGIPGRAYSIQYSNDINDPAWTTLATSTADNSGVFEFVDTPPAGTTRRYRSYQP